MDINSKYFTDLENERKKQKRNARKLLTHIQRVDQVNWASKRSKHIGAHLTLEQIKYLQAWFNVIDVDGSGDISLMELADPLLTTGLANSIEECVEIFNTVDTDGSGEIEFEEFLELVTIKSSGRLERERKRRQRNGPAPTVPDDEKEAGILSVLESLNKNENNSLTVTTAIGIERRKFLLKAVMPSELSKYKLRVNKTKFQAIQQILFASKEERRKSLVDARWSPTTGYMVGSTFEEFIPEFSKQGKDEKQPPAMPWKKRNKPKRPPSTESRKDDESTVERPSSVVLPRIQKFPPLNTKTAYTKLRSGVLSGPTEKEQELYIQMSQEQSTDPVKFKTTKTVYGCNVSINRCASERALNRKDVEGFFRGFLPRKTEDLRIQNSKSESVLFAEEKFQEEDAARKSRILSKMGCIGSI